MKTNNLVIIIRGPLGVGKTSISKKLASLLKARYISIDNILRENKLDKVKGKSIPLKNLIKANEIAAARSKKSARNVIDGNFYSKTQIENLLGRFEYFRVFTLKAPLKTCILRDAKRKKSYGEKAATAVYKLADFDYGIVIDTNNKSQNEILREIKSCLTT